jgi:hypothetical protein
MGPIQIGQEPIDLYDFRVKNRDLERQAIIEIHSQILKWLQDEKLDSQIKSIRCNSILLNKLTYYIANDIEEKNRHMIISRGWYKYGPCFEAGRRGEESLALTMFDHLLPSKKVIQEVEKTCKKEVPLFLKNIDKNQDYPFEYLKHIYTDRVDYPKIQNFYLAKHNLTGIAREYRKESTESNIEELNRVSMDFDKEILAASYRSTVNIPPNDIDLILEFSALMNQILNDAYENPDQEKISLANKTVDDFINIVLMTFANKNYLYTFKTSNLHHKDMLKKLTESAYDSYIKRTESLIGEYYQTLNT